jgi:hypothetical protein
MAAHPEQPRLDHADRSFDPYYKWLGIPASEQPAHFYRLLALATFEADGDVIEAAADRQMSYVKQLGAGPHSAASQKLLNELSAARVTLLDQAKKAAYDQELRARLAKAPPAPIPLAKPAAAPAQPAAACKRSPQPVLYAAGGIFALALGVGVWAIGRNGESGGAIAPVAESHGIAARSSKDASAESRAVDAQAVVAPQPPKVVAPIVAESPAPGGEMPAEASSTATDAASVKPGESDPPTAASPKDDAPKDAAASDPKTEKPPTERRATSEDAGPAGSPPADVPPENSAAPKPASPPRSRSSSARPRRKSPAQQITVAEARYGKPEANIDLTERIQKVAGDGLLVAFVEPFLAERKFGGELYLRGQLGKQPFEQKFGHRQFVFLDARPAPKPPKKGLAVLDAFYGAGVWGEEKMVDVKPLLSEREKGGRIDVSVKELVAKTPDPAPGTSKVLIVRYALDGNVRLEMFEEHQTVRLGAP